MSASDTRPSPRSGSSPTTRSGPELVRLSADGRAERHTADDGATMWRLAGAGGTPEGEHARRTGATRPGPARPNPRSLGGVFAENESANALMALGSSGGVMTVTGTPSASTRVGRSFWSHSDLRLGQRRDDDLVVGPAGDGLADRLERILAPEAALRPARQRPSKGAWSRFQAASPQPSWSRRWGSAARTSWGLVGPALDLLEQGRRRRREVRDDERAARSGRFHGSPPRAWRGHREHAPGPSRTVEPFQAW